MLSAVFAVVVCLCVCLCVCHTPVNIETSYFVYSVIVATPSRRTTNRP